MVRFRIATRWGESAITGLYLVDPTLCFEALSATFGGRWLDVAALRVVSGVEEA
jgi:hypothetical protein